MLVNEGKRPPCIQEGFTTAYDPAAVGVGCSSTGSAQTGGAELHDNLQNGRFCSAVIPDICYAGELISSNLHVNKLCSNISTDKDNVMVVLEKRSYSNAFVVWLP